MALILCIETSTPVCSVALYENNNLLDIQEIKDGNAHASELTNLIDRCMNEAGKELKKLDAVAVSKGPGSYTGLRVGVSTAKGLCFTLNKPLISVGSIEALAQLFIQKNTGYKGLISPMIDARRMEVYTALFDQNIKTIFEVDAVIIDASSFEQQLALNQVTFLGSGAEKCKQVLNHHNAQFSDLLSSAEGMGTIAFEKFKAGEFENLAYFEPDYLKEFDQKIKK